MAIQLISDWLNGERNYQEGLSLFERYIDNPPILLILKTGKNSFTKGKLLEELQKFEASKPSIKPEKPIVDQQAAAQSTHAEPSPSVEVPKEITKLKEEQKRLYKERDYLRMKLIDIPQVERFRSCERIMNIHHRIHEIYRNIDHFNATGVLLSEQIKKSYSPQMIIDLEREISNKRSSLSKAKSRGNEKLAKKHEDSLNELLKKRAEYLKGANN